jgi:hypothetical protein
MEETPPSMVALLVLKMPLNNGYKGLPVRMMFFISHGENTKREIRKKINPYAIAFPCCPVYLE